MKTIWSDQQDDFGAMVEKTLGCPAGHATGMRIGPGAANQGKGMGCSGLILSAIAVAMVGMVVLAIAIQFIS